MTYRLGFAMAQVAGHATYSDNLRRVAAADPTIDARWCEIAYQRPGGRIERIAERTGRGQGLRPVVDLLAGLGRADVDALLANTPLIAVYPRRLLDCPITIDFDSTPIQLAAMEEYGRPPPRDGPVRQLWDRRVRRLWSDVERFQAWSHWAKMSAVGDYGIATERIVVNPPGVDLERWSPPGAGDAPAPDDRLRILFVGGDLRRKGGDLLVEWFRRARPPDTELHVVTREPVPSTPGVVVHDDMTPNSERLIRLYRQADLFVLPTRAECFGIATVEAMAVGLPVVVGDVGASSEIVDDGDNGYLVRPGDADHLADAVTQLLADDGLRRRMAVRSRAIAESRFDLVANATRTLSLLKSTTGRANGP